MVAARGSPYLKGWESGVTCQIIQMWLPDLMVKWDPILRCGRNDEGGRTSANCFLLPTDTFHTHFFEVHTINSVHPIQLPS